MTKGHSMRSLVIGERGQIALPQELRDRYGLRSDTSVHVIETQTGILLIPQTAVPMSAELIQERSEWQSRGAETWNSF